MSYTRCSNEVRSLCPVAIKLGQGEICAPDHFSWGVVVCEVCREQFAIGPNRIYGSRLTDIQVANVLEGKLAEDHKRSSPHQNSYELPD